MAKRKPQSGHCLKCGCWRKHLHKDHIIPRWRKGPDTPDNWQYLCSNCHEDKTYEERASVDYRAMQSAAMKARMTPEARAKLSAAVRKSNASRQWTPEMRARTGRPGIKRKPFTAEHKENMSAARRGKPLSIEHREALKRAVRPPWSAVRRAQHEAKYRPILVTV